MISNEAFENYKDSIELAARLSGNFIDYSTQDNIVGKVELMILCNENHEPQFSSIKRSKGYGKLIFRFYKNDKNILEKMSLCNYHGLLSEDIEESMQILSEYL